MWEHAEHYLRSMLVKPHVCLCGISGVFHELTLKVLHELIEACQP